MKASRRRFLCGAGGLALALPWLEIDAGSAHAAPGPTRFVTMFGGFSLGADGDVSPNLLLPTGTGVDYELPAAAAPLAARRDRFSIVSGLRIPLAAAGEAAPPAGRSAGVDSFHFHVNPLLTGNRQVGDSFDVTVTGSSADQIVADAIGTGSRFASIAMRAQASAYGADRIERTTLSFRKDGPEATAIAPYVSPVQLYHALVSGVLPTDEASAAKALSDLGSRKSVLDLVDRRSQSLRGELGAMDRQRLERHLDEVRALEVRLDSPLAPQGGNCSVMAEPIDPEINAGFGYSGETERSRLLADLLVLALSCDLTRVSTLMLTSWQSLVNVEPLIDAPYRQHTLQHEASNVELGQLISWHMGELAYLIERLASLPEGGETLLDRTALVFLCEGGYGAYESTSEFDPSLPRSSHSTADMVAIVAGGAGGLSGGRHIVAPKEANHPANVLLTAMNAVGAAASTLGEVTGEIDALFA